jgi:hypothetical protein
MSQSQERQTAQEIKAEVQKGIGLLKRLRDEIRVEMHLAGMEAKDRWQKTLEPRLGEIQRLASNATRQSREAVEQALKDFRAFRASLKPKS